MFGACFLVLSGQAVALTKPERKAVDIAGIDAQATSDAALAKIRFKGDIQEELGTGGLKNARVTVELIPASGPTTAITDRKASRRPKEGRTGTAGRFEVVRNGRAILVLVEELPAPAAQISVTTSDPTRAGARVPSRGFEASDYDVEVGDVEAIETESQLTNSITSTNESLGRNQGALNAADAQADKAIDDIADAERDLRQAKGSGAARDARERLEKAKKKLKDLTEKRKALRAEIRTLERWLEILEAIQSGETKRQCNDGVDNGDPEDEIADHAGGDPGCISPVDNDEKHNPVDLTCPGNGSFVRTFVDVFTSTANTIVGYRLTAADGTVIAAGEGTGPVGPTPVASPCGGDSTATFSYGAGSNAPRGLPPFSPPSGETGARFVIQVDNPPGGSPGPSSATVIAALDTRGP